MNIAPLRKSILKESAIIGSLLLGFLIAVVMLGSVRDDFQTEKNTAIAVANQRLSEKLTMDTKFTTVINEMWIYNQSQKWASEPGLFIDTQAMRDLFNFYQGELFLKKLSADVQPIVDITDDPKYVRPNFVAQRSQVRLTIDALSDEDVIRLVRVIQTELPGFARITAFNLLKKQDLSKEILTQFRKDGAYPLVGAEITFDWYGMKSTVPNSPFNKYVPKKREAAAP